MAIACVKSKSTTKKQVKTFDRRFEAIARILLIRLGKNTLDDVKDRLPDTNTFRDYKKALELVQIKGLSWKRGHLGFFVGARLSTLFDKIDPENNVLVFPIQTGARASIPISILRRFEPWTVSTLPSMKGGFTGKVVAKTANKSEVARLEQKNKKDLPAVAALFRKAGIDLFPGPAIFNGEVQIDLARLAVRTEYGYEGYPKHPHWRPALSKARKSLESVATTEDVVRVVKDVLDLRNQVDPSLIGGSYPYIPLKDAIEASKFTEKLRL